MVGAPAYESRDGGVPHAYNRAWHLAPGRGLVKRYDKMQLVPFGEYIPMSWLLRSVDLVVEAVGEFGRGTEYVVFDGPVLEPAASQSGASSLGEALASQSAGPVGGDGSLSGAEPRVARFSSLICYEGIFPALTRRFVAAGADFLVNISNDAWYGATSAPYQHLAMVTLRAVENRVPVVRATNTGVSAFIYADGSAGVFTPLFEPDIGVERILLRRMDSVYRRVGDVFVYLCLAALLLLGLRASRPRP